MIDLAKPVRRVARGVAPHGFNPDLVITIYPGAENLDLRIDRLGLAQPVDSQPGGRNHQDAVIGIREARQRKEHRFSAVALLERAVKAEVEERLRLRRRPRSRKRRSNDCPPAHA